MGRYHSAFNPCFAGHCAVLLADGSRIAISKLHAGDMVQSPVGPCKVTAVVKTEPLERVRRGMLCRIGDLWVTPWHPCFIDDQWTFPALVAEESKDCDVPVFSVMLQRDGNPDTHAIDVAGVRCVTLGHGIMTRNGGSDVRAHDFFGSYEAVTNSLATLPRNRFGQLRCAGISRGSDGLAYGFLSVSATPWHLPE
jgi:hypothetical protein